MGICLSNYVGPVLFAKTTTELKPTTKRICPNSVCNRIKVLDYAKFCPSCGSEITEVPGIFETIQIPTYRQIQDAFTKADLSDNALVVNTHIGGVIDIEVYFPNVRRDPPRDFCPNHPSNMLLDITDCDIAGERAWFEKVFAPEIAVLKTLYKSIEVKWAICNYES